MEPLEKGWKLRNAFKFCTWAEQRHNYLLLPTTHKTILGGGVEPPPSPDYIFRGGLRIFESHQKGGKSRKYPNFRDWNGPVNLTEQLKDGQHVNSPR